MIKLTKKEKYIVYKNIRTLHKDYVKSNRQTHVMGLWNKIMYQIESLSLWKT